VEERIAMRFTCLRPAKQTPTTHELVEIQRRLELAINALADKHIMSGNLLADTNHSPITVSLINGQINLVEHGLSRTPVGHIVVWSDSPAVIWNESGTDDRYLALGCLADVDVRLLVF
jgi:hypothetical protein